MPPSILSKFNIICAILRQAHLLVQIHTNGELASLKPDAFFVDQLSAGLPLLQWIQPHSSILFYCHFPDLLLVKDRQRLLKKIYRFPFDKWEQLSMSFADAIAVNSKFTRGIVTQTWPSLARSRELKVVYPCVDTRPPKAPKEGARQAGEIVWKHGEVIISINRFERKKDIALAIKAFAKLSQKQRKGVKLVIAGTNRSILPHKNSKHSLTHSLHSLGGYESRVAENVDYHKELVALADSLGLSNSTFQSVVPAQTVNTDVIFILSMRGELKPLLLKSAKLLVYTPSHEHFGIVPLEAMLLGVPVLAASNGGPTETVVEGETGWLRDPGQVDEWADVMDTVLNKMSSAELAEMRRAGVVRVQENFGDTQMAERLDRIFAEIENPSRSSGLVDIIAFAAMTILMFLVATIGIVVAMRLKA